MAKLKRKSTAIAAAAFLVIVAVVVAVIFLTKSKNYTALGDIDLQEYRLSEVEFDRAFYLNEPDVSGDLVFRNADGEEVRADLADDEVEVSGFVTNKVGKFSMQVTVKDQSVSAPYEVTYKDIRFEQTEPVCLSMGSAFELEALYAECTDYYGIAVGYLPLSEIFPKEELDLGFVTDTPKTASVEYNDASYELEYTVGYLGYGNVYFCEEAEEDGGTEYYLDEFTLYPDEDSVGEDAGYGRMTIIVEMQYGEPLFEDFDFTWTYDYVSERITISFTLTTDECTYDLATRTLRVGANVMYSSRPLSFRLELDGSFTTEIG